MEKKGSKEKKEETKEEKKEEKKSAKDNAEAEVWGAIFAFEQILEAMPNDRASLEALSHAYEQIGDQTKASDYLIRLGNVVVDEGDMEAASAVLEKVKAIAEQDPRAKKLADRIEKLGPAVLAEAPKAEAPAAKGQAAAQVRSAFNIAEELSLAWTLMEAGELTQEEYSSVVQDLTEMSAAESATTISVLHVLESRGFKNLEKVLTYVAHQCATPIVSLSSFEIQKDAVAVLPRDFMLRRGVILFEMLGSDGLVVIMNPYDKQLRKDVEALAGRKCHFFLALPSEFDKALQKANEMLAGA